DREERLAERVGLPLQGAELVLADVQVLRRERDEAAAGQFGRERLVGGVALLADGVLRPALEPMLADDDRPLLAGFQVFRQKQNSIGDPIGENVEDDLVAGPVVGLVGLAAARVGGQQLLVEAADDVVVEDVLVLAAIVLVLLGSFGGVVQLLHECGTDIGALG